MEDLEGVGGPSLQIYRTAPSSDLSIYIVRHTYSIQVHLSRALQIIHTTDKKIRAGEDGVED